MGEAQMHDSRISDGAQPEKYDDTLLPFLALMRRELHANSKKGDRPGWLSMSKDTALLEIYWHTAKLSAAVKNGDDAAIAEHSADVANMAMMLLDVCGGLTATTPDAGNPASAGAPDVETLPCEHCAGNGEIVTDWERYKHPQPGDVGDEAVSECPECDGTGRVAGRTGLGIVMAEDLANDLKAEGAR